MTECSPNARDKRRCRTPQLDIAKRVQSLSLPGTIPILHVGRGVVFAQPPPARPRPRLPITIAAKYALDAAVITARLHAEGVGRLAFGPSHLRLVDHNGDWQIHWLVPGIVNLDLLDELELKQGKEREQESEHARWKYDIDAIQRHLWHLCGFLISLIEPPPKSFLFRKLHSLFEGIDLERDQRAAIATLVRLRDEGPHVVGIHDAASLARLFATIARLPLAMIESLPVMRTIFRC